MYDETIKRDSMHINRHAAVGGTRYSIPCDSFPSRGIHICSSIYRRDQRERGDLPEDIYLGAHGAPGDIEKNRESRGTHAESERGAAAQMSRRERGVVRNKKSIRWGLGAF